MGDQNQYVRGNLFLLPIIVSVFYILLMLISKFKNRYKYEPEDRSAFIAIILFIILAIIAQIIFKDFIILWSSVAIALLLYYVILREIQFTYDAQTGVKNRKSFEREMDKYINYNKEIVICVFDINNLKENNDLYGHKYGDELIFAAAETIQEIFMDIGKTYRIGGDEFCVICEAITRETVEQTLSNFDDLISKKNQNRKSKLSLAYGYAFYNKERSESIYSAFAQADKAMYDHKAKLKGIYGGTLNV